MGKGIALQFKNKWPANFKAYQKACKGGEVVPGKMYVYDSGGLVQPNFIINFPTKQHWRGKSKIEFIQDGLEDLVAQVRSLNIESIAIPPLGCGNGGLEWEDVKPLIVEAFEELPDIEVRLFAPEGAPDPLSMEVNTSRPRMTPGRAAILAVLRTYASVGYGLSKIEIQKLAYFLQEAGEALSLNFVKHNYGPYSQELRHALNRMEGHFIRGLGDGVIDAQVEPDESALEEAESFIEKGENSELVERVKRVEKLIDGFQSPYGMELLASVHWVASNEVGTPTIDSVICGVHEWNERKRQMMRPEHIEIALDRLSESGWIN